MSPSFAAVEADAIVPNLQQKKWNRSQRAQPRGNSRARQWVGDDGLIQNPVREGAKDAGAPNLGLRYQCQSSGPGARSPGRTKQRRNATRPTAVPILAAMPTHLEWIELRCKRKTARPTMLNSSAQRALYRMIYRCLLLRLKVACAVKLVMIARSKLACWQLN